MIQLWKDHWQDEKQRKYCRIALIILGVNLMLFYAFIYNDILETTRVGMNFWYDLLEGKLRYFYARSTEMPAVAYHKMTGASYEFPIYIIFAIWNFPLFLLEKLGGINIFNNVPCLMWAKTILLVFLCLLVKEMWKLCKNLGISENVSLLVCAVFLTSNFLTTSVIIMCSYEVISIYFSLLGINSYLAGNEKGFHLSFVAAVSVKFFALFLYLPLLLLREKRIPRIVAFFFLSLAPVILCRILIPFGIAYPDAEGTMSATSATADIISGTTSGGTGISGIGVLYAIEHYMEIGLGRMYFSVFAFVALFLICYLITPQTKEQMGKWVIYICLVSYSLLFITFFTHPYWIIILVPFVAIATGLNVKYLYGNVLVETVMSWGMILAQIIRFPWCFGNAVAEGMYIAELIRRPREYELFTIHTVLNNMGLDVENIQNGLVGIGMGIFISALLVFLILNFPAAKWRFQIVLENQPLPKWLMAIRILSGWGIALLPVGLLVMQRILLHIK